MNCDEEEAAHRRGDLHKELCDLLQSDQPHNEKLVALYREYGYHEVLWMLHVIQNDITGNV